MDESMKKRILAAQRNEITEYHVYTKLAELAKNEPNAQVLRTSAKPNGGMLNSGNPKPA